MLHAGTSPEPLHRRVEIEVVFGGRVALYYEQLINVPSSCFGELEHFASRLRVIE